MSAVLTPSIYPEYLRSLIQEELKPVLEELERTKEELRQTREELRQTKENIEIIVENVLATSELKVLKRIQAVETVLGLNDLADEPTIPERLNDLAVKIDNAPQPTESIKPLILPKTTAEKRAVAFMEGLLKKPHSPTGVIQADDKEIKEFIKELPEELRSKDKNERKIKERIIKKAKELYPDLIEIHKSPYGRHETSVCVKGSYQSNRTVRTSIMLAGELL